MFFVSSETTQRSEDRIAALEEALQLDSRLDALEARIRDRASPVGPWWRDARTVTILGALIAAVLPVLSFINNAFTSYRESRRLFVEQ
jgi:hypothetical protein